MHMPHGNLMLKERLIVIMRLKTQQLKCLMPSFGKYTKAAEAKAALLKILLCLGICWKYSFISGTAV